jgi:hypothetical protein
MSSPVPALLVLRRVPDDRRDLAAAMAGLPPGADGDVWWELVDAAAPAGQPAAGVALTRTTGGVTHIVTLAAVSTLDRDLLTHLVRQLVAALRRTDTGVISIRGGRPDVDDALLTEDFVRTDHGTYLLYL